LKCPTRDCAAQPAEPSIETKKVDLVHHVDLPCSDANIERIHDNIDANIDNILGAWPGVASKVHSCAARTKRQSSSTLTTSTTLTGPDATSQAALVTDNIPQQTSVNGVPVTLDSTSSDATAPTQDDGGLSGGAIAGIVIGSIVGAGIVLVATYFVVMGSGNVESV